MVKLTDIDPLRISLVGSPKNGKKFLIMKGESDEPDTVVDADSSAEEKAVPASSLPSHDEAKSKKSEGPMPKSKIVASSVLRDALERRAAYLLESGEVDRARALMSVHNGVKTQLPDGGFVVLDKTMTIPASEGLATFAQFESLGGPVEDTEDMAAVYGFVDDAVEKAKPMMGKGKMPMKKPGCDDEEVEKAKPANPDAPDQLPAEKDEEEAAEEEDEDRPPRPAKGKEEAPAKEGEEEAEEGEEEEKPAKKVPPQFQKKQKADLPDESVKSNVAVADEAVNADEDVDDLAVIDSFADVIKTALRNKSLGRVETLKIIQDAFNSLGEAIGPYVEKTKPAGQMDMIEQMSALIDAKLSPVIDKISEMELATQKSMVVAAPREPVSKSLRPRPTPPQQTRKPGPLSVQEVVQRSMRPMGGVL